MNKFGKFVAERKIAKGITLRGMAGLMDFLPAYWSDIEKGRRNPPSIENLKDACNSIYNKIKQQSLWATWWPDWSVNV